MIIMNTMNLIMMMSIMMMMMDGGGGDIFVVHGWRPPHGGGRA